MVEQHHMLEAFSVFVDLSGAKGGNPFVEFLKIFWRTLEFWVCIFIWVLW